MSTAIAAPLVPASNNEFAAYLKTRSRDLRDELVVANMPLVKRIANHFAKDLSLRDDLVQVGYVGLIKAVENFNPTLGVPFEAYARPVIGGEMSHYLRDLAPVLRPPRWYRGLNRRLHSARETLVAKLEREPSAEELAEAMNTTVDGVEEILKLRAAYNLMSLSPNAESPETQVKLEAIRSRRQVSFQLPLEDRVTLDMALDQLATFERKVVYLFFFMDLTQTEIAEQVGSNQRQVSRTLAKTLQKMRDTIA